tara:strand:+ start:157 stop:438 length:282 start_codon:yes stop_codon:yes gene_type:complete
MKLLKLIPAAAIVFTAFLPFEAKAGNIPDGWTKKNRCSSSSDDFKYYKLQKTDTPASYGVYKETGHWEIENVSYNSATDKFQDKCGKNDIINF